MENEKDYSTKTFHIQLLTKTMDMEQYPLVRMIIENNISKQEYDELFEHLEGLYQQYTMQKEEGLLDFTSLLVHFAGMLNVKLHPDAVIAALKKEGYYPSLMDVFMQILKENGR
ncbi:DUF1878 family protein [Lentibacillus juripiscarius]|uniref:DUF1878 family protein n=1 Tax=Lentibacillus juripiscarius TaxID=257446 RepID=A0ABW5V6L5_9BACI